MPSDSDTQKGQAMNEHVRSQRHAKAVWRGIYHSGRHNAGTRTGRRVDNRAHKRAARKGGVK